MPGRPLRIALLSEVFCKNMGYLENMLPKYFACLNAEVHVVATDLPPDYRRQSPGSPYAGFLSEWQPGSQLAMDGFTLHILGHQKILGHMRMAGLGPKLREISPDIVQVSSPIGWIALDAARFKAPMGYRLFTGCHYHASVFPLATQPAPFRSGARLKCFAARTIPGRMASLAAEKCYAITADCAEVAVRFFGVPRSQIDICPLGVDTRLFHPVQGTSGAADRAALRRRFGFSDDEIVCIYTGRFTEDKNPLLLAKAVAHLREQGHLFRGLFIGNGLQADNIRNCSGCVIRSFETVNTLGAFFRAADVGVWPAQESLSMLDAAACGLPIVVNHTMTAPERIAGNGLTYLLNDSNDLLRALLELKDPLTRQEMGRIGAVKMARDFSWESVARRRLRDYEAALRQANPLRERSASRAYPERTS
jgi:glycosyltransferase involved in cell wall biosynthesis